MKLPTDNMQFMLLSNKATGFRPEMLTLKPNYGFVSHCITGSVVN